MTDHERGPQVDERALEEAALKAEKAYRNKTTGRYVIWGDNWEGRRYAYRALLVSYLSAVEARPAQEPVLPCDVKLPPWTTLRKGCSLSTLMTALKQRETYPPEVTKFAPVELDDLRKEREEARAELAAHKSVTDMAATYGAFYAKQLENAQATLTRTQAQLEEAVRLLERVDPALNDMFSAGIEEGEGGSTRRREKLMRRGDELRAAAADFVLSALESGDE